MTDTIHYELGSDVVAFTTKRTLGRDRARICQLLGIEDDRLVIPHQTHGTQLLHVDQSLLAASASERLQRLEGIDAVVTNLPGVCIGVSTADCIPVLLHDPARGVVAAIHAGWRGTVGRIVEHTVGEMQRRYGTRPSDLVAVVGPGIQCDSFEVGDELYHAFHQAGHDMQRIARQMPPMHAPGPDKWHINLPLCNQLQLLGLGLQPQNIQVSPIDTYTNTDILFSARIEQTGSQKCGRNFNAIMLKPTL